MSSHLDDEFVTGALRQALQQSLEQEEQRGARPGPALALQRLHDRLAHEEGQFAAFPRTAAPAVHKSTLRTPRFASPRLTSRWLGIGAGSVAITMLVLALSIPSMRHMLGGASDSIVREYSTTRAQRASLDLPDGSHVTLAPETHLRYSVTPSGHRFVELDGQAFFSVTHNIDRSFTVRARATDTRVLGTSFVVRAYVTDRAVQVAVAEGRVAVGDGIETTVLLAGDVGSVQPGATPEVRHDARVSDVFGWMRGQLAFHNAPLREVIEEMERTYDLKIQFADPLLANRPVTAVFTGGSAITMLDAITIAADLRYTWQGKNVVLSENL